MAFTEVVLVATGGALVPVELAVSGPGPAAAPPPTPPALEGEAPEFFLSSDWKKEASTSFCVGAFVELGDDPENPPGAPLPALAPPTPADGTPDRDEFEPPVVFVVMGAG